MSTLSEIQSLELTPLSEAKQIFGSKYIGSDQTVSVFQNEIFEPNGVLMNPLALEAFAKAGHSLIFMPALSVQEIVQKTAGLKQKDDKVMYYPDQFNEKAEQTKPWWKNVERCDFSPFILGQRTTNPQFLLVHPSEIKDTPHNRVSVQLKIQKEYYLDILGDLMPSNMRLACDSLTPEVLSCLQRLENKDWEPASNVTLSLPFTETLWPNLAEDMYSYAAFATLGEKTITRREMYNRVKAASPNGYILVFGSSEDGVDVRGSSAGRAYSRIGLFSFCRVGCV